jgi:hypothetical protein
MVTMDGNEAGWGGNQSPMACLGESTPVVIMAIAAKTVLCYSLSLDDPEVAAASLLSRAKLVEQMCVEAGANLR